MKIENRKIEDGGRLQNINLPIITIITVVRNCEQTIENTLLSIINQNYPNIEFIIIDGASTDNTKVIIRKYEKFIDFWLSEPDKGIYDAMNKGISLASGDFVIFMNGGDEFHDDNTCKNIFDKRNIQTYDVIYGDFIAKDDKNDTKILIKAKPIEHIWKGMVFSHQSAFIRLNILRKYPFDLKYRIVADFNQIINIYLNNGNFLYIPHPFSLVTIGGLSYSNIYTTVEQIKVINSHQPFSLKLFPFIPKLFFDCMRIVIGKWGTNRLRKLKWNYLIKRQLK